MTLRIHALLKTRSPLHIGAPGNMRFDPSTGNLSYGDVGVPCTSVQKLELPPNESGNKPIKLPVVAANNIAGRLRRHGARIFLEALKQKGQKVSLSTYNVLQCGAATGNPSGADMTYGEYQRASQHPYLGLFGGGPKMVRRSFRVHNALPITDGLRELICDLAHPDAELHSVKTSRLTQVWGFRRIDDLRNLVNIPLAEASVEHFAAEFEQRQRTIVEEAAKKNAGGDAGDSKIKSSTKTYNAIEFVVPNIDFNVCIELAVNDAQAGLFFLALDSFAAHERLGGHARNGFGCFSLEDVRAIKDDKEHSGLFQNNRLVRNHEFIAPMIDKWYEAAQSVSASELETLLAYAPKKAKKG